MGGGLSSAQSKIVRVGMLDIHQRYSKSESADEEGFRVLP